MNMRVRHHRWRDSSPTARGFVRRSQAQGCAHFRALIDRQQIRPEPDRSRAKTQADIVDLGQVGRSPAAL